ncbi:MAG: gliding motility-associated C-terminal domain-containing protein [Ginsengibacter sp.]
MIFLKPKFLWSIIFLFLYGSVTAQLKLAAVTPADSAGCERTFFKEYANSSHSAYPVKLFLTANNQLLVNVRERRNPYMADEQTSLTLYDTAGNVLRSNLFDGDNKLYLPLMIRLMNGNFAAAGNVSFPDGTSALCIIEFDKDLNLLWEKELNFSVSYNGFLDMVESEEGNIYLYMRDESTSLKERRQLLKLTATGDPVWFKEYYAGSNIFYGPGEVNGKLLSLGQFIFLKYNEESDLTPRILKIRKDDGSVVWARHYKMDSILDSYSINLFSFITDRHNLYLNGRTNYTDVLLKIDTANGSLVRQLTHTQNGLYLDNMVYSGNGKLLASGWYATGTVLGLIELDTAFHVLRKQFLQVSSPGALMDLAPRSDSVTFTLGLFYISDYLGTINLAKFNFESSFASCEVSNPSLLFQPLDIQVESFNNSGTDLPLPDNPSFNVSPVAGTFAYSRYYCGNQPLCNSVKISGPSSICDSGIYHYSAMRNAGCNAHVNWVMLASSDSVDLLNISDTSVDLHIKKGGNYRLGAKIFGSCSWIADSMNIIAAVKSYHSLNLGADTTLCEGKHLTLNAGAGYSGYKWQDGSKDTSFTVSQPGTYFVTVQAGCNKELSDTIVVSAHPPIPFDLGADTAICKGDSITLAAPPGFSNYLWTPGIATAATITVSPSTGTIFKVHADADAGCTVTDSLFVGVINVPEIHLGKDTGFCQGQSLTLDAGAGFDTYGWNTGDTTREIVAGSKGLYKVTAFTNGCSATDSMQVLNVYQLPSFSLGPDTSLCEGQDITFSFNLSNASYSWSTGSTSPSVKLSKPGTYYLTVAQNGCNASDTVNINYQPAPVVSLGSDTTICEATSLMLSAANANATYLWQDGSTAPQFKVTSAGIYFVIASIGNCRASDTITVNLLPLPKFTFQKGQYLCMGQTLSLSPVFNTPVNYLWQDGSTGESFTVSKEGIYFLTASNRCGSYTDSITISPGLCKLMMPNAFSPNNDGINDVFRVKYPFPVHSFDFQIFDRFGEKVYESADIMKGWDGTFKGQPAVAGSYSWTISVVSAEGKSEFSKGLVMLIR